MAQKKLDPTIRYITITLRAELNSGAVEFVSSGTEPVDTMIRKMKLQVRNKYPGLEGKTIRTIDVY